MNKIIIIKSNLHFFVSGPKVMIGSNAKKLKDHNFGHMIEKDQYSIVVLREHSPQSLLIEAICISFIVNNSRKKEVKYDIHLIQNKITLHM